MPHSHSEIYAKIDRAASISDRVSAAMLRHNMAALAERGTFHSRMAMVKQHQMNRLTRVLKTLFAQATEIFAMGPKLKTVTFDIGAT